jgi:uncharacterized protein (TIRG00374 family)
VNYLTKSLLTVFRIALGIGLLYYVVSTTGGWSAAKQFICIAWLLPGQAALTFFSAAIESKRMVLLFRPQGIRLSFGDGYRLVAIGTFFNFCIPGGTGGDVMKLYYLASENRSQVVEVATVLLVDRAVALFSLLFLVVTLALLNGQLVRDYPTIQWLVGAALVGMIGLLVLAVISCSARVRAGRLYAFVMARLPLHRHLEHASDALYAFREHKMALVGAALLSILGHTALAGMFLTVGTVLIPNAKALATCVLALLGLLANALPITPGGLGVGEAAFERLFRLMDYSGGAQLMLAWRVATLPLCLVGCVIYILGARRHRHVAKCPGEGSKPLASLQEAELGRSVFETGYVKEH